MNSSGGAGVVFVLLGAVLALFCCLQLYLKALAYRPGEFDTPEAWETTLPVWARLLGVRTRSERAAKDRQDAQVGLAMGIGLIAFGIAISVAFR